MTEDDDADPVGAAPADPIEVYAALAAWMPTSSWASPSSAETDRPAC